MGIHSAAVDRGNAKAATRTVAVSLGKTSGFSLPDSNPADKLLLFFSLCLSVLLWIQLTTNIMPGSKKVVKPNSGPSRARLSAALTVLPVLMLTLAL